MKTIITIYLLVFVLIGLAQDTTKSRPFTFFGYIDTYYGYDFGKPSSATRPDFLYSHSHHNQVNANLVFVKFAYAKNRFRFNLTPMLGTYSQANLSGEPFYLRQIFEANLGVKLMKKKELWLDAGIFPSHIGFESAISKDCATLSRSILAENSPYFETGIKLTYQHNAQWTFTALVLNGWQKIRWQKGKSLPSFGTQITYQPNEKLLLNYSTFIGTDNPDSIRKMRYFHNLYAIYSPINQLSVTLGFDIGTEQKAKQSAEYNLWFSPVFIIRYNPVPKFAMAARYEFYSDKTGVLINVGTINGFQTHGFSLNFDYLISPKVVWRAEARAFKSKDPIFVMDKKPVTNNYSVLTSLAIMLSK